MRARSLHAGTLDLKPAIRHAAGVVRFLSVAVTVTLAAGVFLAQWLAAFPVVPHAPRHDCQQHRCGCPAELTARHACCCFGKEDNTTVMLRPVGCGGGEATSVSTLIKFQWALVVPDGIVTDVTPVSRLEPVTLKLQTRYAKPPVPPPRFCVES